MNFQIRVHVRLPLRASTRVAAPSSRIPRISVSLDLTSLLFFGDDNMATRLSVLLGLFLVVLEVRADENLGAEVRSGLSLLQTKTQVSRQMMGQQVGAAEEVALVEPPLNELLEDDAMESPQSIATRDAQMPTTTKEELGTLGPASSTTGSRRRRRSAVQGPANQAAPQAVSLGAALQGQSSPVLTGLSTSPGVSFAQQPAVLSGGGLDAGKEDALEFSRLQTATKLSKVMTPLVEDEETPEEEDERLRMEAADAGKIL